MDWNQIALAVISIVASGALAKLVDLYLKQKTDRANMEHGHIKETNAEWKNLLSIERQARLKDRAYFDEAIEELRKDSEIKLQQAKQQFRDETKQLNEQISYLNGLLSAYKQQQTQLENTIEQITNSWKNDRNELERIMVELKNTKIMLDNWHFAANEQNKKNLQLLKEAEDLKIENKLLKAELDYLKNKE